MKPTCHFLLAVSLLLIAACQPLTQLTAPSSQSGANQPSLHLKPPAQLGHWQLAGSLRGPLGAPTYLYQLTTHPAQTLSVSIYPYIGQRQGSADKALQHQASELTLKLKARAASRLHALHTSVTAHQQLRGGVSGQAVINNRFLVSLPGGGSRMTLMALTLLQGHFVRLTASGSPDQADRLAALVDQARHRLVTAMLPKAAAHD